VYFDLATEKPALALKNVEKAQELERISVPVLASVTSRLLEAYLRSFLADHKSAVLALREGLSTLHARKLESARQYQDPDWFHRVRIVLLYNLAVESFSLHLRSEAMQYISKAFQALNQHDVCEITLKTRILAFKEEFFPSETDNFQSSTPPEEEKLPFLPGGQVAASDPGKLVELTQEPSEVQTRSRKESQRLPKIRSLQRRGSKENPYAGRKEKQRYGSVQPSLKRKM
jgi:hypothetical protein